VIKDLLRQEIGNEHLLILIYVETAINIFGVLGNWKLLENTDVVEIAPPTNIVEEPVQVMV
jgi:hypothetical protein